MVKTISSKYIGTYLQEGPLHAQHPHGVCVSKDLQGVRRLGDAFNLLVDLSQDLVEKDGFDVHSEKLSKRTLFGWAKPQGMLDLLNKSGRQSKMVVECIRETVTEI